MIDFDSLLNSLGIYKLNSKNLNNNKTIPVFSPVDGRSYNNYIIETSKPEFNSILKETKKSFLFWKSLPAPKRGEFVRQLGNEFRKNKKTLGKLISYEMGKSIQEGYGEVQEMIDICDFAVGLSRQLCGKTMHSERPVHRMYEQYHPLGVVGIISAFNFPAAVWAWNAAISFVCGNTCIWKPSEKTPLTALACQNITQKVLKQNNYPDTISSLIQGGKNVGEWIAKSKDIPLVSATGSTKMGKQVTNIVSQRLGKSLLELGGNNAMIVTPSADLKKTIIAAVFGVVGTTGQRCTSTRRLIIHKSIYNKVKEALTKAFDQIKIGTPLDEKNHMGPLIDEMAVKLYSNALKQAIKEKGVCIVKGRGIKIIGNKSKCYVKPAVFEFKKQTSLIKSETFAPILYLLKYDEIQDAINIQNDVSQGLSSTIMTTNLQEAELFLSHCGSDCGIANVNIGTSGAEIGGAFGGEKDTGGGRESGSDAWKFYMRRQTNTINFSDELPLAQGIKFNL